MNLRGRRLGVNIDHIATLREARGVSYPDPLFAAKEAIRAGADQITVHLREDRRHIQDADVRKLRRDISIPLNLEMAATPEMFKFAAAVKPDTITLVPEKRQELTTEGGLNLLRQTRAIPQGLDLLRKKGVRLSAFIEANHEQVIAAKALGFDAIEFHTGEFCLRYDAKKPWKKSVARLRAMTKLAKEEGLLVFAGHGLNEGNISPILKIEDIEEYNIGHSLIAQAVFYGLYEAVRRMKALLR